MQRYDDNLATPGASGGLLPLSGVSVTVTNKATGLPATVYADDAVTALTQPLTTGNNGEFGFRAPDGVYVLTFSGSRIATFTREIVLDDPTENAYASKAELAALSGATMIGYQRPSDGAFRTVASAIDEATATNGATIRGTPLTGLSTADGSDVVATDTIIAAFGKLCKKVLDLVAAKDASGGYAGLTLFKINFKNAANTFTSFLTNANTAARTYTFPDKDITVAGLADIPSNPMTLLGSATVGSAVANIDFLSLFTTAYDKYVIEVQNVTPSAASNSLYLRCAVSGTADSGTNYFKANFGASSSTAVAFFDLAQASITTTSGFTTTVEIRNANDTTNPKVITGIGAFKDSTPSLIPAQAAGLYIGGKVTGIRLYWSAGANFTAGTVRVYGIKNT